MTDKKNCERPEHPLEGIVGRLREQANILAANTGGGEYLDEAADEIERLRNGYSAILLSTDSEMRDGDFARDIAEEMLKSNAVLSGAKHGDK